VNPAPFAFECPVLQLSQNGDCWTVRDAVEGVQIFGKPGSGKTSGSGKMLAHSLLNSKLGGLVLCVKSGEAKTWLKYGAKKEQLDRFVVFSTAERLAKYKEHFPELDVSYDYFNPFTYENNRPISKGGGTTQGIVDMFLMAIDMADRINSGKSGAKNDFWEKSMRLLLTHTIGLLKLAERKGGSEDFSLTVRNINKFINSTPRGGEELDKDSYVSQVLEAAEQQVYTLEVEANKNHDAELIPGYTPSRAGFENAFRVYDDAFQYFYVQYFPMAENQRSGIEGTLFSFAGYFMGDGILANRFSRTISENLLPSVTMDGECPKIIILDFPLKLFGVNGLLAQSLYKTIWQNTIEGRTEDDLEEVLPCFLWIDEAQFFLTQRDQEFLTTAREAKCITCLITQSKANYDQKLGPQLSNALLNLLGSVVFHWQNNPETNAWAVKVIAQEKGLSESETLGADGTRSKTYREEMRNQIEPYVFLNLKPDLEKLYTYGIFYQSGRTWSNGKRYLEVTFDMMYGKRIKKGMSKFF